MLSKVDLRDFFEINQGLYDEPVTAGHHALIQMLAQDLAADTRATALRDAHPHEHNTKR